MSVPVPRVLSLQERHLSLVNQAVMEHSGDVLLLCAGAALGPGALQALLQVAGEAPRPACVWPVVLPPGDPDREAAVTALSGLPLHTVTPVPAGAALLVRGEVLGAVGPFDESLPLSAALADWALRAQVMGFLTYRANRVFTTGHGGLPLQDATTLARRHPHLASQRQRFATSVDSRLPERALRVGRGGRVRVALDLRHLEEQQVGTYQYALRLAGGLAQHPQVELTLLVWRAAQAGGVQGRVVQRGASLGDVDVIHKPVQLHHPEEPSLLFNTPAHLIVSYQDLIAHHGQALYADPRLALRYRDLSYLTLHAAQRVLAISDATRDEIAGEFGLPREEIPVVLHGVDAERFAAPQPRAALPPGLRRYFLAVGTDYPHKNLALLLAAHQRLREGWRGDGPAPELVLAGSDLRVSGGVFSRLRAQPQDGVRLLGAVSDEQLVALYQHAEALVFPSVYEGFGLPPLEAMAAGTPALVFAISAMPQACGAAALYPPVVSAAALAEAMEQVASDPALRERLRQAGRAHIAPLTWERTVDQTVAVYRDAVLRPSPRSLRARLFLRDVIPVWAMGGGMNAGRAEELAGWLVTLARRRPQVGRVAQRLWGAVRGSGRARRLRGVVGRLTALAPRSPHGERR